MKKISKKKMAVFFLLLLLIAAAGISGYRFYRKKGIVQDENYAASCFLERGFYARGRNMASQALDVSSNDTSIQLILLSFCYEEDFLNAEAYGNAWLKKSDNSLTAEICEYARKGSASGGDMVALLRLHNQVKEQIRVSESGRERLEAALEILSMEQTYDSGWDPAALEEGMQKLENAKDVVSLKAKAYGSMLQGDTRQAALYAQQIVKKDDSLPNRMAAANAVSEYYLNSISREEDSELSALEERISKITEEINELQQELEQALAEGRNSSGIEKRLDKKQDEAKELYSRREKIPYQRAVNYMKSRKPQGEHAGYEFQMAYLYYRMGERETAGEIVNRLLSESVREERTEYLGPELRKLLEAYNQTASGEVPENRWDTASKLDHAADAAVYGLTQGLSLENSYSAYFYEPEYQNFCDFMIQSVREYREMLLIRYVDTRKFPQIDIHLTTALPEDISLEKEDLSVYELGEAIPDFEFLKAGEGGEEQELSLCFVLDVSGSMEGEALEHAKSAAGNLLNMLTGRQVQAGLVKFENSAEIVSELTESSGVLSRGIDSLTADGGTNISDGLRAGMEVLQGGTGSQAIILLSDGEDSDTSQIETIKNQLAGRGIKVYSVGVGYADSEYLRGISEATGGVYMQAVDTSGLGAIYRQIGQYMFQDYVIRLTVGKDVKIYDRSAKVQWKDEAYDESEYTVGVPDEDILWEEQMEKRMDFYREIGGSGREVTGND
ncbi:MAG: VWA domain-containing protein [Lachnospiraceae bacterium]|nr:VWA domain-containing protein [Lachnospiraceae bacterium]